MVAGVSLVSLQSREKPRGCAGCNGKIRDRFMLQALDRYWHEDCLKCACCDCRLGRVGSTLYTRANLILCRRDYLRYGCQGRIGTVRGGGLSPSLRDRHTNIHTHCMFPLCGRKPEYPSIRRIQTQKLF